MIQLPHPPTVPDDCPPHMVLGWRIVYPDLTSRGGFRWPFPGRWIDPVDDGRDWSANGKPCPSEALGGYCIAKTWSGASSASIRSQTCLLVAYDPGDVLGEDHEKVRVRRALVLDVFRSTAGLSRGAYLSRADLTGAYLSRADLSRADLTRADLSGAYLIGANLTGAYLIGADLTRADLSRAYLSRADLTGADLTGAYLTGADLTRADLSRAYLSGAYLTRACLTGAYLTRACLSGACLSGACLSGACLSGAKYTASTVWPAGVDPVARGAVEW